MIHKLSTASAMKVIRNNAADDGDNYRTAEDMTKTKMDHIDMLEDEGIRS